MFYIEDDSEDAEEKVNEGPFSRTEDVYHGKAPPGILVSAIHQYILFSLVSGGGKSGDGKDRHPPKNVV